MTTLFAQPYDITAGGFYFTSFEEYGAKADALRNEQGAPVEEFEIQMIDAELIDSELASAWGLNQCNIEDFLDATKDWDEGDKTRYIIAVGEAGYEHTNRPFDLDVDVYHVGSMRELAEQFVDEGLFGNIPDNLQNYIDYDAIARDLSCDYTEMTVDGKRIIYRCA